MRKFFSAFVAGQALQLILHAISLEYFAAQQLPVCAAAGVMILIALLVGVGLAHKEENEDAQSYEIAPPAVVDATWSPIFERRYYEN